MTPQTAPIQQDSIRLLQPSRLNTRLVDRNSKVLILIFILTLPLINPWVRGDGVGYYAYIRSLLIEHRLDFSNDWRSANESFKMGLFNADGSIEPQHYTRTGHLENHFSVGPAMLWAPFLVPIHGVLLVLQKFGLHVKATGYSKPYLVTMALATAVYGYLGLVISYRLACRFVAARWAFLATLGIWFASSLPVYMYFNPSWSHAHSLFAVAVFLWYWLQTRGQRTPKQWIILGLISGLVMDVYYPNIAILTIPLAESVKGYWHNWSQPQRNWQAMSKLLGANVLYCLATVAAFLPTLVTRNIIYGSPLKMGYSGEWILRPALLSVLLSSDHGLLVWTPILTLALAGLFMLRKLDRELSAYLLVSAAAFYLIVCFHSNWDGLSSFGNRFFISLTPFFVIGLAVAFSFFAEALKDSSRAWVLSVILTAILIGWNGAFIFQWGTHLVPARGPISWPAMVRNQFTLVPERATSKIAAYFGDRRGLMKQIEQEDVRSLKAKQSGTPKQ